MSGNRWARAGGIAARYRLSFSVVDELGQSICFQMHSCDGVDCGSSAREAMTPYETIREKERARSRKIQFVEPPAVVLTFGKDVVVVEVAVPLL